MTSAPDPATERVFDISYFDSLQDNRPHPDQVTWARTARALTRHMARADKTSAKLWSPARFKPGTLRARDNVECVSLIVFDIDDGLPVDEMEAMLGSLRYVISSSYSHTPRDPHYRVVIDLVEPIPVAEYTDVWRRANRYLAGGHVDPATKDPSRMYFFPSHAASVAEVIAREHDGIPLDWRTLPPLPAPPPMPRPARRSSDDVLRRRAEGLLAKWGSDIAAAARGTRHELLLRKSYAAGGLIASGCLDDDHATEVLLAASHANGHVQDDGEGIIHRAIADGLREGESEPWTPDELPDSPLWRANEKFGPDPFVTTPWRAPESLDDWPAAERLDEPPPAPPFPLDCLPRVVATLAGDIADRQQAPVDYAAWGLLVALAGLIGKVPVIRPKSQDLGWSERAALWVGLMGMVSSNKSSVLNAALRPLYRQREVDHRRYEQQRAVYEAELLLFKKEKREGEPPVAPEEEDVITSDATTEKLALMVKATHRSTLTIHRDELAGWLLGMDKYSAAGGDREFYLQSYSGGPFSVHRVGRPSLYVPDLLCNVVGTIQPEKARAVLTAGADDGLAARFAIIWPEVRDWQLHDRAPNLEAREALDALHEQLVRADWRHELQIIERYDEAPFVGLDPDARRVFDDWYSRLMVELRTAPPANPRLAGRFGKYPGLAARLLLICHLAEWASGETRQIRAVRGVTAQRVMHLMERYVRPMDERVYHAFGITQHIALALRLARRLQEPHVERFTTREACRWLGSAPAKEVRLAIDWLAQRNWCREEPRQTGLVGRPSEAWTVNPRLP